MPMDFGSYETNDLLLAWNSEKSTLASVKARESAMRAEIVRRFFPKIEKGTNRFDLGKGYKLKAVHDLNYSVENGDKLTDVLKRMSETGNEGPFIAARIIKRKPELSVSEYNALLNNADDGNGTARAILTILNEILTIKPGSTALEIEEPKA